MTDAELLEIIARAEREGWTELDLSGNDLEVLPPQIGRLQSLEKLILGKWDDEGMDSKGNRLTAISQEIFQLTNLKELHISFNQITAIPDAIAQLANLTTLSLYDNQITAIPDVIAQLANLTTLSLADNQITAIPDAIAQLANLTSLNLNSNQITAIPDAIAQLANLTTLNLDRNQITAIPDAIAQLANLTTLDLNSNQITAIPDAIAQLAKLQDLNLASNQIGTIPDIINQLANLKTLNLFSNQISLIPDALTQLAKLQWLRLSRNQISIIPNVINQLANLQTLDFSENQISIIPNAIVQLSNLKVLDLSNNPLPIPPEILNDYKNPAAIIGYWQKLKQGGRKLNEAKVILVGHGAVGKTSLVRQLIDRDFNPEENKTEGIDIRHWTVTAREENVRLRVWDFGGQEIMHATHQFFLTERSLYLLVLNARKDEGNNDVEYWLKIIESFGKDAPVIVITNKSDEHPLKLNRRHLQDKYPNIQAFFETSCKTGLGIDELRHAIAQQISAMDHVFDVLPQQWFRLKEQIEKLDRDHISYLEYEQLCATEEISDKQERRNLIRLLHLLGIVLNFAEDTRLQDTNVLNPAWVTGGVYRILNDNLLSTKHKGMLATQELDRILKPKTKDDRDCYQDNRDRQFILDMMQKFELCFPLDTSSRNPIYLIPELLDEEEPDTGNWENTLNFEYHYKILFSSIVSRFIVKMNHCISKRTYWRTGVILANKEGNRASVKADLTDGKVFIRIDGNPNTRRAFLSAIRNTFDSIHDSISALEVDEQVPLPDNPKETVSYEHLLSLEKRGKTDYSDSDRDYNIRELLDGIEDRRDRKQKDDVRDNFRGDRYSPPTVNVNISNNNQQQTTVMTEPEKPQLKNHSKTKEIKLPPVVVASMAFVLLFLTTAALVLTFAGVLNITSFIIAMFSIVLLIVIGVSFILKVTGQIEGQSFEKIILAVLKQLTLYDAFLSKIGSIWKSKG